MSGFFCLWMPHFAAWTFEQSERELRGKAFAVVERGRIIAASPRALSAGVAIGVTVGRAQSQFSDLLLVERDRRREELAWSEVQRAFYGLSPKVEAIEMGLLFADVNEKAPTALLRGWGVCGGWAQDRASAYLAALSVEAGTTRSIKGGRERAFADSLSIDLLANAGVTRDVLGRLRWFGWTRVGHLRALSRRQLEEQFGPEGTTLFHFAQGPRHPGNCRPVPTWTPPEELVASLSFEFPAREPGEWDGALDVLLERVCAELGSRSAQTLEVVAHTPLSSVAARRVLKEPLSKLPTLRRPLESALMEALRLLAPLPPIVNGLEVRLGGLVSAPVQEELFPEEKSTRARTMGRTLERLESRFAGRTGRFVLSEPDSPFPEDVYGWLGALEAMQGEEKPTKRVSPRKAVK